MIPASCGPKEKGAGKDEKLSITNRPGFLTEKQVAKMAEESADEDWVDLGQGTC